MTIRNSPNVSRMIRSAPVAAALAFIGALVIFGALALPGADTAHAQGEGNAGFITRPTTAPAAPTLTARNMAIVVNIPAPATDAVLGSPDYTGFNVQYKKTDAADSDWMDFNGKVTVNTRNLSGAALITGLENGSAYHARVRVTRGDDTGPWSLSSAAATPTASLPGKVRNLKAVQTDYLKAADRPNSNKARVYIPVSWDPPADDGGSPVTSYKFETFRGGTGNAISSNPTKIKSRSYDQRKRARVEVRLSGAPADHNRWIRFKVAANNAVGTGEAAVVEIRIDADAEPKTDEIGFRGMISSDSAWPSGAPQFTVKIKDLKTSLPGGASVVLFLEDDFQVPDSIPASSIYFVANDPTTVATGNGAPVYATLLPVIETDDYFDDDKDDISIRVQIPDMCLGNSDACAGHNPPIIGQNLTMVIMSSSGIKNPSEAGMHSVAFDVLGFNDPLPGWINRLSYPGGTERSAAGRTIGNALGVSVRTAAKISLSEVDGGRGDQLTVTGYGFNDGVTADAYVNQRKAAEFAVAKWWNTLNCDGMKDAIGGGQDSCFNYALDTDGMTYTIADRNQAASDDVFKKRLCDVGIIRAGKRVGSAIVGSDNKVAITFEVTVPAFKPGNDNLICVMDGDGRRSRDDIEDFELTPSISVLPAAARAGEPVAILAQDIPTAGACLTELKLAGKAVPPAGIRQSCSGLPTFDLPPMLGGKPLGGTVRVDAVFGSQSADSKVTILPLELNVSKKEVRPNETLIITGHGFGSNTGNAIMAENITIDGAPLHVRRNMVNHDGEVAVSDAGRFVVAVALWPASAGASNPALTPGVHTIKVIDNAGFTGNVKITIPEPTVKVTPAVAGPRDTVTISGENWPMDNSDSASVIEAITIKVADGEREREYSHYPDGSGRWSIAHRVSDSATIPSTSNIEAKYAGLVKLGSYRIPAAIISVNPGKGKHGDSITLSADRMPVHARISRIEIGGRDVKPAGAPGTDRDGSVTVNGVIIPGLDPGTYSVLLEVAGTIAIGSLEILTDGPFGPGVPVGQALASLGDNLAAVFYYDGVSKTWLFYDPRPEFAELNTLTDLVADQPYWILVNDPVVDVALGGKSRRFTCNSGNCWNLMIW